MFLFPDALIPIVVPQVQGVFIPRCTGEPTTHR